MKRQYRKTLERFASWAHNYPGVHGMGLQFNKQKRYTLAIYYSEVGEVQKKEIANKLLAEHGEDLRIVWSKTGAFHLE